MMKQKRLQKMLTTLIISVLCISSIALGFGVLQLWYTLENKGGRPPVTVGVPDLSQPTGWPEKSCLLFRSSVAAAQTLPRGAASILRLAGTFFSYDMQLSGNSSSCMAVVEVLASGDQEMVSHGETIQGYEVVSIRQDSLTVRGPDGVETTLIPAYSDGVINEAAGAVAGKSDRRENVLSSGRFGKQVMDNRWVLKKGELLKYSDEVLNDPERVASLYISLKPDYDADKKIGGYELDMVGEEDFFGAVGLEQGDVIRKVNSMEMTSQRRAEYFLSEFMNDRLGAVVVDIERNGKEEKLIYMIRDGEE